MHSREKVLESIRTNTEVSVLIVGAGINGVGAFRDLGLQGIDVLLIEKGDFSSGTSAATSHKAHGGLRYLENGEFRLVRESVQERNLLVRNAPHLVSPSPTTIPIFKLFSGLFNAPFRFLGFRTRPQERGALLIKLGLLFYDAYSRQQARKLGANIIPTHSFHSREKSLKLFPLLNPTICCTATTYDASVILPERLCVEMINDTDAVNQNARAVNYVTLIQAEGENVLVRDEISGECLTLRPKIMVNATGPWIDNTNHRMGKLTRMIGGTKGSHIVLDNPHLFSGICGNEFYFENSDGRMVLIYPLVDKVLVGATDIPYGDPDKAICSDEEIDYFLNMVGKVFPSIRIDRSQIVYHYSGVRPLPSTNTDTPEEVSRDHRIQHIAPDSRLKFPVYCLVGGKWTTFRAFVGQLSDMVLAELNIKRCINTQHIPIGGGRDYPSSAEAYQTWLTDQYLKTGVDFDRLETLFKRYGTYASEIAAFICQGEDRKLCHLASYSSREVVFLAFNEQIVHLVDLLLRRTPLAMLGQAKMESICELADILGDVFGWSPEECQAEIAYTCQYLSERHGVKVN
jgi:glycerol-3-phosphate dehydrogenase